MLMDQRFKKKKEIVTKNIVAVFALRNWSENNFLFLESIT